MAGLSKIKAIFQLGGLALGGQLRFASCKRTGWNGIHLPRNCAAENKSRHRLIFAQDCFTVEGFFVHCDRELMFQSFEQKYIRDPRP